MTEFSGEDAGVVTGLRAAENRHAHVAVRLVEKEAEVRALEHRVALTEQLHEETSKRLGDALAQARVQADGLRAERDRAHAELAVLAADQDAASLRHERAETVIRDQLDDAGRLLEVERRARLAAEAERDQALASAATERGRLLARVAHFEQSSAGDQRARAELARYENSDVQDLLSELDVLNRALADAREQLDARGPEPEPHFPVEPVADVPADDLRDRVAALTAERDALERTARAGRGAGAARVRDLEQLVSTLSVALAATRDDIERAERSRAWRVGHGMSRTAARVTLRPDRTEGALAGALRRIEEVQRATRALPPGERPSRPEPPVVTVSAPVSLPVGEIAAQRRLLAAEIRDRLGQVPELETWPAVSIVVPSRNGRVHLERLVDGLRRLTDYPALELVVVDNGSNDGSAEWLRAIDDLPAQVVRNEDSPSFSEAINQGAAVAEHELLLFLNNDVEPFEPGWLHELVAAHVLGGAALTGATLLHAETTEASADGRLVQHHRIALRRSPNGILPVNVGDGTDLFGPAFGVEQPVLAVSAACLLVTRPTFTELGGISTRYRFGLEDLDLALRAREADLPVLSTGRSVLYHHESATRLAEGADFVRATREANRRALRETWGPQLERLHGAGMLTQDRVVTATATARAAITVTSLDESAGWGDWYTAHELGDALDARGWQVEYIAVAKDGTAVLPGELDYVITLLDRFDVSTVAPGTQVVAWVRNWVERWLERPWLRRVDLLLASSRKAVDLIEQSTGRRPELFPLATNPAHFATARADSDLAVDCVFTGNRWGKSRRIEVGLAPARGQSVAIYGRGWEDVKGLSRHARGVASYDDLPALYASAKLVLDDTQEPTLRYDAVNARVFDALAAGSLVLTNCAAGVRELFDDEFPTWSTRAQLREQRAALLADDARRDALVDRYRAVVLSEHTYARRADRMIELLRERAKLPSFCIKIGAPDWEQADRWGDLHFARAIERELRRRGHRTLVQVLEEWENDDGLGFDVALHLKGRSRHFPKPGQFNVLWCISHPDELTGAESDGYDLVALASAPFAERFKTQTSTPVMVLGQATDPMVFHRDPDPDRSHDVVYVANSRNVLRPMMRDLLPTDLDLAVYGANWDGLIDAKYVVAEYVPNDELRRIYSSAKVVLADHWDDMREHGFIANRIYDALACGATVVSDHIDGLDAYAPAVRTYSGPEDLRRVIDEALAAEPVTVTPPVFSDRVATLLAEVERRR